jgi:hypothetical protein
VVGGIEGSPLIFTRTALDIGLPFRAFFFEKDDDNALHLADALHELCKERGADGTRLQIIPGDHNSAVPWFVDTHLATLPHGGVFGLGYGDGNGKDDAPFVPMAALADRFPQVDLLLNVNATIYKRLRGANPDAGYLLDSLGGIAKKHRLIREPVGIHQWTMVFQTNWATAPEFSQIGFRRLSSPDGRRIVEQVNFSKREVSGSTAPFAARRPIAATPSISGTPASSPSGPTPSPVAAASASGAAMPARPSPTT